MERGVDKTLFFCYNSSLKLFFDNVPILAFFVRILAKNKHKEGHKKYALPLCQRWRGVSPLYKRARRKSDVQGISSDGTLAGTARRRAVRRPDQLGQHREGQGVLRHPRQGRPADDDDRR